MATYMFSGMLIGSVMMSTIVSMPLKQFMINNALIINSKNHYHFPLNSFY